MNKLKSNEELCASIGRSLEIFVSRFKANCGHLNKLESVIGAAKKAEAAEA
ncbi:hypothetical protein FACS18949_08430 [Clostridia bacterium]|nr:hypothetical protein FACS18949_08430 [Clostridia bacterium]